MSFKFSPNKRSATTALLSLEAVFGFFGFPNCLIRFGQDHCIFNQTLNPENNIIVNIIVCEDDETAKKLGAVSGYPSASIGAKYDPYNYYAMEELKKQVEEQKALLDTLTGVTE